MRNSVILGVMLAAATASLSADVTVVQKLTLEGQAAAMMQGAKLPTMTMRIKGRKSRSEVQINGRMMSTIADLDTGQIIVLDASSRTATVTSTTSMPHAGAHVGTPSVDMTMTSTGKSQTILGEACTEQAFTMTVGLGDMGAQMQLSPEAAETLKDVRIRMNGSFWVATSAPGAAEFVAFNKAAAGSKLLAGITAGIPGLSGAIDKLLEAGTSLAGVPYMTRMTLSFEGNHPMVEMMKSMGGFTMVQQVESVSTDPLPDDLFTIPAGYTIEKK